MNYYHVVRSYTNCKGKNNNFVELENASSLAEAKVKYNKIISGKMPWHQVQVIRTIGMLTDHSLFSIILYT